MLTGKFVREEKKVIFAEKRNRRQRIREKEYNATIQCRLYADKVTVRAAIPGFLCSTIVIIRNNIDTRRKIQLFQHGGFALKICIDIRKLMTFLNELHEDSVNSIPCRFHCCLHCRLLLHFHILNMWIMAIACFA